MTTIPAHDHTADNATTKWISYGFDFDGNEDTDGERTYVTVCWGADFIATSYPGHLGDADAIARAVGDFNAPPAEDDPFVAERFPWSAL